MDAEQLRELATNAETNHWPAHLGVTTDAEKVEYLAARLREVADTETRLDELTTELETADSENGELESDKAELEEQVKSLKADIVALESKLESVREIVG
jgi:peptidoglycan hydrolase CwlO-like protein